ncbi:hypothetical protein AWH48_07750 [Domibacillus aminovorans]|uniref:Yip1 domain-containing protein n=1 Tax=Domibacillus aminovorans TaxID=29332 RepID=A0A177KM85_9BACI|nr:CHY zinc finger protein [Domibacillus aminovorans]OAH54483.1 hypothetical protein AWH48_07750 [Domibacillus aminovorans]
MKCNQCGHEQASGNFCGNCGTSMEVTAADQPIAAETTPANELVHREEPNMHVEKVKNRSRQYWDYFVQYIKKPSLVFGHGEREFINGLISMAILAILIGLTGYTMTRNFTESMGELLGSDYYTGPSFSSILSSGVIFTALFTACALFVLFLINRFFGSGHSLKEITGVYGVHLLPSITLMAISLLLVLLKAYVYSSVLMSLSLSIALFVMPLYLISALLTKKANVIDPLYSYFLSIIFSVILFAILVGILADSAMGEMLHGLFYM